jgi:hypothetical protein
MPTYDVLVSDELLPEFTNDNSLMPEGFRILGSAEGPAEPGTKRFRVQDDTAPAWTEGKLINPAFTNKYEVNDRGWPTGNIIRVTVTSWTEATA